MGITGRLVTLDNEEILGTHELLTGTGVFSATRMPDGKLDLDRDDETKIDGNGQTTAEDDHGETLYVTASGNIVPESQLRIVAE